MRCVDYWVSDDTLIVSGNFFGVSTGLLGGWKKVRYAFNHTVSSGDELIDPVAYLRNVAKRYGLRRYFGLLTAVPMDKLCITECGSVLTFATAGVLNPNERIGTINVIVVVDARMSRAAMLNAIITVTEAKSNALLTMGYDFTGTNTDAVIVLSTCRGRYHRYSGPASDIGREIWHSVRDAVLGSVKKWG